MVTSKHNSLVSYFILCWRRHVSATVGHLQVTKRIERRIIQCMFISPYSHHRRTNAPQTLGSPIALHLTHRKTPPSYYLTKTIPLIILNSVCQHNHFITQGNCKATCFDCRLVILRSILSTVSQDAMHTLGSHRVYIRGIHQFKSFVSKGVTCKYPWNTSN